ncbi:hypothetical protein [Lacticaseibacillus absianus]|uniref:hypothetical protein n=1 Tax=Lacticaseibacillus absianus TaxID=2729623 RepID=UPI0015C9A2BE|nr:hypothetical protein [Lacticaseibacillus absianus]
MTYFFTHPQRANAIGAALVLLCLITAFLIPTWVMPIVDGENTFYVVQLIFMRSMTAFLVWLTTLVVGVKLLFLRSDHPQHD